MNLFSTEKVPVCLHVSYRNGADYLQKFSQVFEKNIASACSLYKTDLIHFYVASQVISIWSLHYGNILAPVRIYIRKVNNRNTRIRCEICSKLTLKIPEQCQWRRPGIFLVNFEHISHLALVFLLVTLNM